MKSLVDILLLLNEKYIDLSDFEIVEKKNSLQLLTAIEDVKLKYKINTAKFIENKINIKLYTDLIIETKLAKKIKKDIVEVNEINFDEISYTLKKLDKLLRIVEVYYKGQDIKEFLVQEIYNLLDDNINLKIKKIYKNNNRIVVETDKEMLEFERTQNNIKNIKHTDKIDTKILKNILLLLF